MAYLNTDQAARFLGFMRRQGTEDVPDRKALREYLERAGVPTYRRGRSVLVRERDLDVSLEPGRPPSMQFARRKVIRRSA